MRYEFSDTNHRKFSNNFAINCSSSSSVQDYVFKERIVWKHAIERLSWWEGFYESLVKSIKECMHKIFGKALLNYEG